MKSQPPVYGFDLSARGRISYVHGNVESSTNAFDLNENSEILLLLPRSLGAVSLCLQIFDESLSYLVREIPFSWRELRCDLDVYSASLDSLKTVGLYFFRIRADHGTERIYGYRNGQGISFSYSDERSSLLQLSIYSFDGKASDSHYGGIIYHVFVDRFNRGGDSVQRAGTVLVDDWSRGVPEYPAYPGAPLKNNTFYGGTLWGIIDKLDYIKSLGASMIYLSPIFDAASNHKYDTGDYMHVDPAFGGDAALVALIGAARDKGIGIILDGVFNHTGSDSIYFNREGNYNSVGAYQSKDSEYYSWFDFQDYPNKYTCWWGIDILPRINPDNPSCRQYFVGKSGVIDKYSKLGVAGFRLDVVDELSDDFVSAIRDVLFENGTDPVLYGEVWEDGSNKIAYGRRKRYYLGSELDGVMNYPIRKGLISYLTRGDTWELRYALDDVIYNAPKHVRDMQMNLLGTHDTERIITVLGGESSAGRSNSYLCTKRMNDIERGTAKRRLRMAYTILATLPGIPVIFYGDETALEGYHDPFNRMPYPWEHQDVKTIQFYRHIGSIRRQNPVYARGEFRLLHLSQDALIFARFDGKKAYLTVVNNSKYTKEIDFDRTASPLVEGGRAGKSFSMPAFTAEIFVTEVDVTVSIY